VTAELELWPGDQTRHWRLVTDAVMGGVSSGAVDQQTIQGRAAARMQGRVSTENNGGFIQIAIDLSPAGVFDASAFTGLLVEITGNGEDYGAHLRTTDIVRPQQSYRQSFVAGPKWSTILLPFAQFAPHRIEIPLNIARLRRLGLVAIGRNFDADLSIARLALY
jgi:hypothetical protein